MHPKRETQRIVSQVREVTTASLEMKEETGSLPKDWAEIASRKGEFPASFRERAQYRPEAGAGVPDDVLVSYRYEDGRVTLGMKDGTVKTVRPEPVPLAAPAPVVAAPSVQAEASAAIKQAQGSDRNLLTMVRSGLLAYHGEFDVYPADAEDFSKLKFTASESVVERVEKIEYRHPDEAGADGWVLRLPSEGGVILGIAIEGEVTELAP